MFKWFFPSANNSGSYGLNSITQSYKDEPFFSLSKEICQNSLDAMIDSKKTVRVEFVPFVLQTKDFPGRERFVVVLNKLLEYNKKTHQNDKKFIEFYTNALKIMQTREINCLRVSDYNTTGLERVDTDINSSWYNLVKSEGDSDKSSGMGGSFGMGKFAAYAVSNLLTVFYSTLNQQNQIATQGLARLSTFEENGDKTLGKGFFGEENGQYMNKLYSIDNFYERKEIGTDLFILGLREDDQWSTKTLASVIDNYFAAIHERKIELKVDNFLLNDNTIRRYINDESVSKHLSKNTLSYIRVFNAIESSETFKGSILETDDCELKILTGDEEFKNSIAMIRKNGMKIFDKKIRANIYFSAIFRIKNDNLDDFLRKLENPSHTNWSPERIDDVSKRNYAKNIIAIVNEFIQSVIEKIETREINDETDVLGLSEYLPDDLGAENSKKRKEIESKINENIKIKQQNPNEVTKSNGMDESEETTEDEGDLENEKTKSTQTNADQPNDLKLNYKILNQGEILFNKVLVKDNEYFLNVKLSKMTSFIGISILLSADKGYYRELKITEVESLSNKIKSKISNNSIEIFSEEKFKEVNISFKLNTKISRPIEVVYYENK